jgi:hypothetical protein
MNTIIGIIVFLFGLVACGYAYSESSEDTRIFIISLIGCSCLIIGAIALLWGSEKNIED